MGYQNRHKWLKEEVPGMYGCGPLECEDEALRIIHKRSGFALA